MSEVEKMAKQVKATYAEIVQYRALDSKVIVVASAQEPIEEWSAYIGAVPGEDHDTEYMEVKRYGSKLPHNLAALMFPNFEEKYRWRD